MTIKPKSNLKPAESLIEVMVAIALFSIIIVPIFSMIAQVMSTSVYFRDRIEAISLAQEGLEGFRNIRDTNWLRYSGKKDDNWLCLEASPNKTCDKSITDILETTYTIEFDSTNKEYSLSPIPGSSSQIDFDADTPNITSCTNCQIHIDSDNHTYTHTAAGNEPTIYHRQLVVTPSSNPICGTQCKEQKVTISSEVFWKDSLNGTIRKDRLQMELYNFLDRTKYPD